MMVVLDQPIKKRKRYDVPDPQAPVDSLTVEAPQQQAVLSEDEKARKRRNKEEIGHLYNSYRRIKFCLSQKDSRLMPDLEQAYLAMLKASSGCASVQRVAAELIPRYALYCPTALEAACRVTMQIGNWSSSVALQGEDSDGIAFETAKACLFGLVDISCAATSMTSNKSVANSMCSVVFRSILSFFIHQLDGKGLYNFEDIEAEKLHGSKDCFSEIKQKAIQKDNPVRVKLWKIISLSLVRIFFCCPQSMLVACFELLGSKDTERRKEGHCFLRQIMGENGAKDGDASTQRQGDAVSKSNFTEDGFNSIENVEKRPVTDNSSEGDTPAAESSRVFLDMSLVAKARFVFTWYVMELAVLPEALDIHSETAEE